MTTYYKNPDFKKQKKFFEFSNYKHPKFKTQKTKSSKRNFQKIGYF